MSQIKILALTFAILGVFFLGACTSGTSDTNAPGSATYEEKNPDTSAEPEKNGEVNLVPANEENLPIAEERMLPSVPPQNQETTAETSTTNFEQDAELFEQAIAEADMELCGQIQRSPLQENCRESIAAIQSEQQRERQ